MGSVVAALASYLDAKAHNGQWLVRMEDLDPPREVSGAADDILHTLEQLHLHWDGEVVYQSTRSEAYRAALHQLDAQGLLYRCRCSRLQLAGQDVYPGTCRQARICDTEPSALRCIVSAQECIFIDRLQGSYRQNLAVESGDFVLLRKDGYYAYQLAVVVDDAWQGITDIVRGCDLLDSTARQIYLQQLLSLHTPRYAHIPLLLDEAGQKLGKQQFSPKVDTKQASAALWQALDFLQQQPPHELLHESPANLLQWGIANWKPARLQGLTSISIAKTPPITRD